MFSENSIPVLHNVDALPRSTWESQRDALEHQLWQPVMWVDTIEELAARGVSRFAECGPGRVLAGLNRRIVKSAEIVNLQDLDTIDQTMKDWN